MSAFYYGDTRTIPLEGDLAAFEGREVEVIQATYWGDLVVRDAAGASLGVEVVEPAGCALIARKEGRGLRPAA